jgi:hypothetical protein
MAPYFEKDLVELLQLPYHIADETYDLASFLEVPAISLEKIKELASITAVAGVTGTLSLPDVGAGTVGRGFGRYTWI